MMALETLRMSVRAVASNRSRSLLTVLGIVIGVAAVIALVSLGQAAKSSITASMMSLGSNIILVETRGYARLEMDDVQMLLDRVGTLKAGSPIYGTMTVAKGSTNASGVEVWGVSHDFFSIMTYGMTEGRFFTEEELAGRQRVCVVGSQVHSDLFDGQPASGETVVFNSEQFTVLGVAEPKGSALGMNNDNRIFIPYTTAERVMHTKYYYNAIFTAKEPGSGAATADHIARILEEKFRNTNRQIEKTNGVQVDPFRVYCQDEMQASFDSVTGVVTLLLSGIAGISLLVGGIGIMNIMLVSVTERTREIGIRKSIGARKVHILGQFLFEALILSAAGGVTGIVLGGQLAKAIGALGKLQVTVSPVAAGIAFAFASAVGLFFGIYPAARAAGMDPIRALRHE